MWKDSGNHALGSQKRPTGPWMVPSANGVRVHTQRTAVVRVVLSCTSCKMGVRRLLTFRVQRCPRHHIRGCPRSVVYHHFCNSRWVLLSRFQGSPPDSEVLSCHSPLGCRSWSWSWSLSPGGSGDRDTLPCCTVYLDRGKNVSKCAELFGASCILVIFVCSAKSHIRICTISICTHMCRKQSLAALPLWVVKDSGGYVPKESEPQFSLL